VHALRAEADAVAVGIETVLADNPELTVRDVPLPRVAPKRVVFDRRARLPLNSALARSAVDISVLDVTNGSELQAEAKLRTAGVEVVHAASLKDGLASLRKAGVRHLLVEGGATLASSFLAAGFVDRLITFQAPVILGAGALPAFAALPARAVETAPRLRVVARRECGSDLMTTYAVSGD
jgi:diaminohydroxyphosphoribosylaminopyrimidine deaminase/5-amino-6-(5-phosphoribosylamino)uracil reductase